MEMSIEEIAKEEGSGFCRGLGNGIKRALFVNGEREQQIREICRNRPLFRLGTLAGAAYISMFYIVPAMIAAYNFSDYLLK